MTTTMPETGTTVERYEATAMEEYRPRILMAPEDAKALDDALRANMRAVLTENTDYGVIPGTGGKPTLLKPGAEKLLQWFGFGHSVEETKTERDPDGKRDGVTYRCTVTKALHGGGVAVVGMCDGYAGYDEERFYTSPGQAEAKERANAERYERKANPLKFAGYRAPWNSVIKMAQKRALVGAALVATSASSLFTQDLEDAVPVVTAQVAARLALREQPRVIQDKVMEWARRQGWPDASAWDASQWCQALIAAGKTVLADTGREDAPPAGEPAGGDDPAGAARTAWLAGATQRALAAPDTQALLVLWQETGEMLVSGAIIKADADQVADLMRARSEDLAADAGAVEGVIVSDLDPDDPWAAKISGRTFSQEDADAAEADLQMAAASGSVTAEHAEKVLTAIRAMAASLTGTGGTPA